MLQALKNLFQKKDQARLAIVNRDSSDYAYFQGGAHALQELNREIQQQANGYANYPTYLVALWLDNDRETYEHLTNRAKYLGNEYLLADEIKAIVDVDRDDLLVGGMYADLMQYAMSEVDWHELAAKFIMEA